MSSFICVILPIWHILGSHVCMCVPLLNLGNRKWPKMIPKGFSVGSKQQKKKDAGRPNSTRESVCSVCSVYYFIIFYIQWRRCGNVIYYFPRQGPRRTVECRNDVTGVADPWRDWHTGHTYTHTQCSVRTGRLA